MLIKNKLYNGEANLNFDSNRHRYVWVEENRVIKSVTSVLKVISKPALINWAANMAASHIAEQLDAGVAYDELELAAIIQGGRKAHYRKKVDAGDLGTFLHRWVEDYINGKNPGMPVNPQLKESVLKFLIWVKKHDVKFLLAEQVVFSRKYEYCGTTDFICSIDGELFIGDLKTSKGIYKEMLIQAAAYRMARNEEYPQENYAGQLIVRIGKDGTFEYATMKDANRYTVGGKDMTGLEVYKLMVKAFVSAKVLSDSLDLLESYSPDKG